MSLLGPRQPHEPDLNALGGFLIGLALIGLCFAVAMLTG